MRGRDWKHIQPSHQIVDVNNGRLRDGLLTIVIGRMFEDGEHNMEVFLLDFKQNFIRCICNECEDTDSIPWGIG